MRPTPTRKELARVKALSAENRLAYSLPKFAEQEIIYLLKDRNNDFAYGNVEGQTVLPIWPNELLAKENAIDGWESFTPVAVEINEFFEYMDDEDHLISVFPSGPKSGFILTIEEFMRDLILELRKLV